MTRIARIDPVAPDAAIVAEAAALLRRGGLVAFPTETVYGLGANALDAAAVQRIYAAKGRPSYNPLIVHLPDSEAARALATSWPDAARRLAQRFWPGPLTLVVPKRSDIPDAVTAGLGTVALRVPAHPVAAALLRAAAVPVAAPSANRSFALSPSAGVHVARGLGGRIDLLLDAGPTPVGIESTVVDVSGERPVVLRPGTITAEEIAAVIGPWAPPPQPKAGAEARRAPGMLDRHYAPRAALRLYSRGDLSGLRETIAAARGRGKVVGLLSCSGAPAEADHLRTLPNDPLGYARALYAALHELDEAGCDIVFAERPPEDDAAWAGVRDRLMRAAR